MDIATPTERVAGAIRAEMARQRKTQAQLAVLLNRTRSSIHRRMSGEMAFSIDELHKVAEYLELPVAALLGEDAAA